MPIADSINCNLSQSGSAPPPRSRVDEADADSAGGDGPTGPDQPSSEPARPRPIVPLLPYQRADVESEERFVWSCWSRQTGKSFTKSLRRILRGLRRRRTQVFLSAGERQSRELMEKARQHCQALKIATDYYDDRPFKNLSIKQLEIVLPGRVRIIGLPANPQTARGFTGDVLLDEFAMHTEDREIWAAMFPTVLRGGGEIDVASTPKGCGNTFHQLRDNPRFCRETVTLPDAIQQGLNVDEGEIRRAMNDDLLFRQEFLCEFLDESFAFLTYEQIAACADPTLVTYESADQLGAQPRELFLGVDVGRHRDLTVIWVLAGETRHGDGARVLETVAIFELANAPFRQQYALLCELLNIGRVSKCCIDAGGLGMQLAEQTVEAFGSFRVEPVVFTSAVKTRLAGDLRLAVENRTIRIPNDERIIKDWHSVRRRVTQSGHFQIHAPRQEGSHADRFWAAALAVRAAAGGRGEIEAINIKPVQFARTGTW